MNHHRARFLSVGITAAVLTAALAACSSEQLRLRRLVQPASTNQADRHRHLAVADR